MCMHFTYMYIGVCVYVCPEDLDTAVAMSHTNKKKQEKIGCCICMGLGLSQDVSVWHFC